MDRNWASLVPELICTNLAESLRFYCDLLGFAVRFQRPEDGFAYLELGGAQLMLEQWRPGNWTTAALERPYGRGINLQIEVEAVAPLHERLRAAGVALFSEPAQAWYREGGLRHGQIEFLVEDPDGYLLRFVEILMTEMPRPILSLVVSDARPTGRS